MTPFMRISDVLKGYLRTGKILQLLGNQKMALDLYEMGNRKVPSSDPNIMACSK